MTVLVTPDGRSGVFEEFCVRVSIVRSAVRQRRLLHLRGRSRRGTRDPLDTAVARCSPGTRGCDCRDGVAAVRSRPRSLRHGRTRCRSDPRRFARRRLDDRRPGSTDESGTIRCLASCVGAHYIVTIDVSVMTRSLMFLAAPLALISLPLVAVRTYEDWEVLCRARWHRPHVALELVSETWHQPWVSVHVPTHAEPPAVVIETLNRLAKLRYRQYEVIVLDNNTTDPALWQPVAEHCRRLGERFHFHHVEGLEGAKAGALNLALEYTDPRAELVAIVDADYHAEPNFLSNCTPFFDDRQMGFVQTPHAYRNWSGSVFQRMCNWEYTYFYKNTMVSLNERNAAITVGTMCVIRREALERAGGWAEWCLTEDSELAVRIHALGYSSIYLDEVYGRGLIPATFEGYRKQRFRWSYGPVQEFQRHWRLLVPGRGRVSSKLSVAQRVHHITHGLYGISLATTATINGTLVAADGRRCRVDVMARRASRTALRALGRGDCRDDHELPAPISRLPAHRCDPRRERRRGGGRHGVGRRHRHGQHEGVPAPSGYVAAHRQVRTATPWLAGNARRSR